MGRRIVTLAVLLGLSGSVAALAEEAGSEGDAQAGQKQASETQPPASSPTPTPLPPGLQKKGKRPHGLEKKGKTPPGWSHGKASWKHPSSAPQAGSDSSASPGSHPGNEHSHHSGHGHHH